MELYKKRCVHVSEKGSGHKKWVSCVQEGYFNSRTHENYTKGRLKWAKSIVLNA
jgi:hypothetical protein